MAKMFVHYNGTVADFKAAGLESKYTNHIVFIKGGSEGKGEAVYTHGQFYANVKEALSALENKVNGMAYFSKISDGTNTAATGEANGTITFSATDPSQVSVDVNTKGVKIGLSEAFKTKVNDTAANLGSKDDAADINGSAFARIANLKSVVQDLTGGSGESVGSQITNAINNLDVEVSTGDYVASISQVDGKIVATSGTFNFDTAGAAATAEQNAKDYADSLANNYDQSGSASTAEQNAKNYADTLVATGSALEVRVKANEDAITTLNGSDTVEGSVDKKVKDAINDFAVKVSNDDTVNTFKEMIDYAAAHKNEYGTLSGDVQANTNAIATLNGTAEEAGSVAKAVKDAVDAEAAVARAAEKANEDAIKAISDDYLKASDKETLQNNINTVSQNLTKEVERAQGAEKANADAIAAMNLTEVSGYVTKVSQTNGKVSATTVANIPAADVTIADTDNKLVGTTVEAALAELADMWTWEEL